MGAEEAQLPPVRHRQIVRRIIYSSVSFILPLRITLRSPNVIRGVATNAMSTQPHNPQVSSSCRLLDSVTTSTWRNAAVNPHASYIDHRSMQSGEVAPAPRAKGCHTQASHSTGQPRATPAATHEENHTDYAENKQKVAHSPVESSAAPGTALPPDKRG